MRVLAIDDNPVLRAQLKKFLELKGFSADTAAGGNDALRKLETNRYDAVLLDIKIKDMPGLAVMQRARERNIDVPFVILTGYGSVETAVASMKLGAVDYVQKPFDGDRLAGILHEIHQRRTAPAPQTRATKDQALRKWLPAPIAILVVAADDLEKIRQVLAGASAETADLDARVHSLPDLHENITSFVR
jgi:two-component system response regulator AtoC